MANIITRNGLLVESSEKLESLLTWHEKSEEYGNGFFDSIEIGERKYYLHSQLEILQDDYINRGKADNGDYEVLFDAMQENIKEIKIEKY